MFNLIDKKNPREKRHKQAEELFQKGVELLTRSRANQFKDKGQVKQACECFLKSIQYNRRDTRPHLFLAYTMMVFQDNQEALVYVKNALAIEPENSDAIALRDLIVAQAKASMKKETETVISSQLNLPEKGSEIDYDILYDQTEALIIEKVKELMCTQERDQLAIKPEKLSHLKKKFLSLRELYMHVFMQIDIIDQEIDTTELRATVKPLSTLFKRCEKVYLQSRKLFEIDQMIRSEIAIVEHYLLALRQKPISSETLESRLDRCDAIADQLDDLEAKGIPIKMLESGYEMLLKKLTTLQDEMDSDELPQAA